MLIQLRLQTHRLRIARSYNLSFAVPVLFLPAFGQRTVRCHGDIVLPAELCHFPFFPENQIVVPLHGYKLVPHVVNI